MNEVLYTPKQLSKLLSVTPETLRKWSSTGQLSAVTTPGRHRRYLYHSIAAPSSDTTDERSDRKQFIYARVSSAKQRADLERQIQMLQSQYPDHDVIKDIGSGINFKRFGLQRLLEGVFRGTVSEIVVAHRDRLCRFGFDLIDFICRQHNVLLKVHDDQGFKEPTRELADDLLSIITVFTARYYGSRKYHLHSQNKNISYGSSKRVVQPMHRRVKVLLQQNHSLHQRKKGRQRKIFSQLAKDTERNHGGGQVLDGSG